ncbi:hypothetical protein [Agrobacterium arsenijevicii]|uniref:Uncharacterized protein n=1 Tax=Agrobacterium arsenijevicii TaxID=1585697 RepID=A0ABR5CZ65_9HYPH|nr:hypothetical protein RP75_28745 [Agrobacterium arsenijevicii]
MPYLVWDLIWQSWESNELSDRIRDPASRLSRRQLIAGRPLDRDLTLEPFQHGLELSVLQPKFVNKLAAQELYLVIEADGLSGTGGSVRKLASGDCFPSNVPRSPRRKEPRGWQGRRDFKLCRDIAAVIGHGMGKSIHRSCRRRSSRNVDSS